MWRLGWGKAKRSSPSVRAMERRRLYEVGLVCTNFIERRTGVKLDCLMMSAGEFDGFSDACILFLDQPCP